jgi:hypothetical protein
MMNDSARVMRRPRRARPPAARTAAALIATAALALLAAACSGSPSSTGPGGSSTGHGGSPNAGGSANSPSAVGYSGCLRSHGVPNYPDPGSGGAIPKGTAQQFGVSSSQYQAARTACQHLLPTAGGSFDQQQQQCYVAGDCPPAIVQEALNQLRTFARCMRSHGVPNWPDPAADSQGGPYFNVSAQGIPRHSPQIDAKVNECERLEPAGSLLGWGER